jgi:hypothetical protein
MSISCLAYFSTVKIEATFSPKRRLTFNGLHGVICQEIQLFILQFDVVQINDTESDNILLEFLFSELLFINVLKIF